MKDLPARFDELEKRLAALEAKPRLPICEKCGTGYMRLDRQEALTGMWSKLDPTEGGIGIYKCDNPDCGGETRKKL